MKKLYFLASLLIATFSFGQAFTGTYDFASVTQTSGATDPTAVPTATGVTFGSFSAVNGTTAPTNSSGAGRFSFANQPVGATNANDATFTGAIDLGIYYQVTLTPQANYTIDLTQITFAMRRSGTGVRHYAVRSSLDGYASNLPASINPANSNLSTDANNVFFWTLDATATSADQLGSTITLPATFTGLSTPVTFRFYAWDAEAAGGNFSIDNVVVTGNTNNLSVSQNEISGLQVYSNNNLLFVTSDSSNDKNVVVYDMLGKVVVNETVSSQPINVANLSSGAYIVKVTEEGKTATKKLVIQ